MLPLAALIDGAVHWASIKLSPVFSAITTAVDVLNGLLLGGLRVMPPWLAVVLIGAVVARRRGSPTGIGVALAAALIWNLGLWPAALETVSLVLLSTGLSLAVGVPVGVLCAESPAWRSAITPVLDYMQTTPAFVYLIPSVLFFGVGTAPGVLATFMFAMPPPARATQLGIAQLKSEISEAGIAFGSTRLQLLTKIKLPLAWPYIALGINQCIMMALNVVVIAALIGAQGLGTNVVSSLAQLDLGKGIEAGTAIVLLALILDRLTASGSDPGAISSRRKLGT